MRKLAQKKNRSFKKGFEMRVSFPLFLKFFISWFIMGGTACKFISPQALFTIHLTISLKSCTFHATWWNTHCQTSILWLRYDRPIRSSNQCPREYPRRVWTLHLRDERTANQVNTVGKRSHQNYGYVLPGSIIFVSSTSTLHIPTLSLSKSSTLSISCQQYLS